MDPTAMSFGTSPGVQDMLLRLSEEYERLASENSRLNAALLGVCAENAALEGVCAENHTARVLAENHTSRDQDNGVPTEGPVQIQEAIALRGSMGDRRAAPALDVTNHSATNPSRVSFRQRVSAHSFDDDENMKAEHEQIPGDASPSSDALRPSARSVVFGPNSRSKSSSSSRNSGFRQQWMEDTEDEQLRSEIEMVKKEFDMTVANRQTVDFVTRLHSRFQEATSRTATVTQRITYITAGNYRIAGNFVINPDQSVALERWDLVTIIGLVWVAIFLPVNISTMPTRFDSWFIAGCMVDVIFAIDLILQFFIMYPRLSEYGYVLEHRHRLIVKHYLKTWFIFDFLSLLPIEIIAMSINNQDVNRLKLVKILRLLRLIKLMRMAKASRLWRRYETRMSITYGRLALLKFFVVLAIITHWLANLWALTLILVDPDQPRWIDRLKAQEEGIEHKTVDTPWKLYVTCLYFTTYTITSVGYGDIGPANIEERIVCIVMIVISGISWAVVLGQVCGIVTHLDAEEQTFRSTMDGLNHMMKEQMMPEKMRKRLRSFCLANRDAIRHQRYQECIATISPGLQGEVVMQMHRRWIAKVPFLNDCLQAMECEKHGSQFYSFMVDLSREMKISVHAQCEVFGSRQTLFILNRGLVSRCARFCTAGAVWGQDFVLMDSRLAESTSCLALTYVQVTILEREALFAVLDDHRLGCPEIEARIRYFTRWLAVQRAIWREARRRAEADAAAQPAHGAASTDTLGFRKKNTILSTTTFYNFSSKSGDIDGDIL